MKSKENFLFLLHNHSRFRLLKSFPKNILIGITINLKLISVIKSYNFVVDIHVNGNIKTKLQKGSVFTKRLRDKVLFKARD